jgi:DNA-binding transcriptional LysR family regulator
LKGGQRQLPQPSGQAFYARVARCLAQFEEALAVFYGDGGKGAAQAAAAPVALASAC